MGVLLCTPDSPNSLHVVVAGKPVLRETAAITFAGIILILSPRKSIHISLKRRNTIDLHCNIELFPDGSLLKTISHVTIYSRFCEIPLKQGYIFDIRSLFFEM